MASKAYERWWRVEEVFAQALDLSPDTRAAFLNEACAGDPELRHEVESLLEANKAAEGFLDDPAAWFEAPLLPGLGIVEETMQEETSVDGQRIGAYRLLRQIGHGGMGAVYLAERADGQFRQKVALKLLPKGMANEEAVRRFRLERQILARLQHPNIALLLDGGVTQGNLPYLVMEYIDGEPIDRYCDRARLTIEARLRLFLTVCEAVQYAHQNLVVHRDLKPSNILVTKEGRVKLLDFGIAKLLDEVEDWTGGPLTRTGQRLMTPAYASPEQVRGETITVGTDIYALGILLCELLTGSTPHPLHGLHLAAIEYIICCEEPIRPSVLVSQTRLVQRPDGTTEARTPEHVSKARSMRPEALRRRLAGDLDNIVLMALRKEPGRRYVTVEQLAADVRGHLEGLPVMARKPTWTYRGRKFVVRHRLGTLVVALILLGIASGVMAMEQARQEAVQRRIAAIGDAAHFLANTPPVQGIIRARALRGLDPETAIRDDEWRDQLASIFASFMRSHSTYSAISFIGADGLEIVCVRKSKGEVLRVPQNSLRHQDEEDYFQEAINLPPGSFFLSKGRRSLTTHFREESDSFTLRVAVPVYTSNGETYGIIVIDELSQ